MKRLPIIVLISGHGSNLQSLIDHCHNTGEVSICAVISNKADAFGLERAKKADIPTHVISHQDYETRNDFDAALTQTIDTYQPELIVLAGFMRRLGPNFVTHYQNKVLNIHPSLLPKYPGLHTHRAVLENKETKHGSTIHIVTEDLDAGPIISQSSFNIEPNDTEKTLETRIKKLEHQLYPLTLQYFSQGRIGIQNGDLTFDGKSIPETGIKLL